MAVTIIPTGGDNEFPSTPSESANEDGRADKQAKLSVRMDGHGTRTLGKGDYSPWSEGESHRLFSTEANSEGDHLDPTCKDENPGMDGRYDKQKGGIKVLPPEGRAHREIDVLRKERKGKNLLRPSRIEYKSRSSILPPSLFGRRESNARARRLGVQRRSNKILLVPVHTQKIPEIFQVHMGREVVPISGSSIRVRSVDGGLEKANGQSLIISSETRDKNIAVGGRFLDGTHRPEKGSRSGDQSDRSVPESRFRDSSYKNISRGSPDLYVPGDYIQYENMENISSKGQEEVNSDVRAVLDQNRDGIPKEAGDGNRQSQICGKCQQDDCIQDNSSRGSQDRECPQTRMGCKGQAYSSSDPGTIVLGKKPENSGIPDITNVSARDSYLRCGTARLGGDSCEVRLCSIMDQAGAVELTELEGINGGISPPQIYDSFSKRQGSRDENRFAGGYLLYPKDLWEGEVVDRDSDEDHQSSYEEQCDSQAKMDPEGVGGEGRFSVQIGTEEGQGVVPVPVREGVEESSVLSHMRCFRDQILSQDPEILFTSPRFKSGRDRRVSTEVGRGDVLLPTDTSDYENTGEVEGNSGSSDTGDTRQSPQLVVPSGQLSEYQVNFDTPSRGDQPTYGGDVSIPVSSLPASWEEAIPSRIYPQNKMLIASSVSLQTRNSNSKEMNKFIRWVKENSLLTIDPIDVANYIGWRHHSEPNFKDAAGVRSKICTSLELYSGVSWSSNIWIKRTVTSASNQRPSKQRYDEMWDLQSILTYFKNGELQGRVLISARTKANILIRCSIAGRNKDVAHIYRPSVKFDDEKGILYFRMYRWKTKEKEGYTLSRIFEIQRLSKQWESVCSYRALQNYMVMNEGNYAEDVIGVWTHYNQIRVVRHQTLAAETRKVLLAAGIPKRYGQATIRHATISFWHEHGVSLEEVMRRTGQRSLNVVMIYYNKANVKTDLTARIIMQQNESSDEEFGNDGEYPCGF